MADLTVLGIGNILMSDEGVGVRLLEAVRDSRPWPASVEFIDGGVGGLNLLGVIESAKQMIVFDAADMRLSAGEWRVVSPQQVEDDSAGRLSLHDMPFIETVQLCQRFTHAPDAITILAIQPASIAPGRELSGALQSAMDTLTAAGVQLVKEML